MGKKRNGRKPKKVVQQVQKPMVDMGSELLRQHFVVVEEKEGKTKRSRVLNHPLLYYFNRREIDVTQRNAGLWLMGDYATAHEYRTIWSGLKLQLGVSVELPPDHDNPHVARERWRRALKSLNYISQRFAFDVCIEGKMVNEVRAHFTEWRKHNNGMDRFCEALDELHEFYVQDRIAADDRKSKQEQARRLEHEPQ